MAPRRNIELKAQLPDIAAARATARELTGRPPEVLLQVDTYFRGTFGRLKLREIDGDEAYLVSYRRPDSVASRGSDYHLVAVPDPASLKAALADALGIVAVVRKRRELSLWQNVRIHLDKVEGLGDFLEFEAVLAPGQSDAQGEQQVHELQKLFRISPADLIAGSYGEMLATG